MAHSRQTPQTSMKQSKALSQLLKPGSIRRTSNSTRFSSTVNRLDLMVSLKLKKH